ncbi:MAG: S8 family serine peptidase [bacterium]
MGKIKIGFIILGSIVMLGLIMGGIVMAKPSLNVNSSDNVNISNENSNKAEYVPDEIIVKYKGDKEPFRVVKLPFGKSVKEAEEEFEMRGDVEYVEPNYIAHAFAVPNDPYYAYQWHLDNPIYGGIQTEQAWDVSSGSGVTVAVVDTGIAYESYQQSRRERYYQAPDLNKTCFVNGYDFVNNDTHPNDDNSHGTHVAGTIAQSTNNNKGTAGVAFSACLMPVKVLDKYGSGTYADVANGIIWAVDNGAKVINLSLGGSASSLTLENAVAYAYNKGVTIVAAAGNDGTNVISYPAAYDSYVMAVGAVRYDETLAYYSNYGPGLDLVAPGGDLTVDQNNDGYADGVLQNTFNPNTKRTSDFGYWFFQGTSMAAPHVAGTAALVLANGNATTPDQVRVALETTAEDLGIPGFDDTYGYGLVDAYAALGWTAGPVDNPPFADAGPDQTAYVGDVVNFDGSASFDPDGTIVSYDWDFGDGTSANAVTVSHSYAAVGIYTVTLVVTDNNGLTAQDIVLVNVLEAPAQSTMHVGDITFSSDIRSLRRASYCRVTATVPILDSSNAAVDAVDVYGSWSDVYVGNVSGSTNSQGTVSFQTGWVRGCGTFTFTVNDVVKGNWLYDPSADIETSDSITLP